MIIPSQSMSKSSSGSFASPSIASLDMRPPSYAESPEAVFTGLNDSIESFKRSLPKNLSYEPGFKPLVLESQGGPDGDPGFGLHAGFPQVPPKSDSEVHPFVSHDVRQKDWISFLRDLMNSCDQEQSQLGMELVREGFYVGESPPGDEGTGSAGHVLALWNQHFFHPRRMNVILSKVDETIDDDDTDSSTSLDSSLSDDELDTIVGTADTLSDNGKGKNPAQDKPTSYRERKQQRRARRGHLRELRKEYREKRRELKQELRKAQREIRRGSCSSSSGPTPPAWGRQGSHTDKDYPGHHHHNRKCHNHGGPSRGGFPFRGGFFRRGPPGPSWFGPHGHPHHHPMHPPPPPPTHHPMNPPPPPPHFMPPMPPPFGQPWPGPSEEKNEPFGSFPDFPGPHFWESNGAEKAEDGPSAPGAKGGSYQLTVVPLTY